VVPVRLPPRSAHSPYTTLFRSLLALATVHLLPQLAGAAGAVLPSKLTNMLASGRPVIATAAPGSDLAIEIDGCGIATPPHDAERSEEHTSELQSREKIVCRLLR